MITACICVMLLLALATLWMNRKSALADALATKDVLDLAEAIVNEHAAQLSTSRQLLTSIGNDGRVDDSTWLEERDFFIDQIIEPRVGSITNSLERLLAVWQMIDDATAELAEARSTEPPDQAAAEGNRFDAPSTIISVTRAA